MKDASVTLNNGESIPQVGLGTWRLLDNDCYNAIKSAISLGYRHIDTACCYENEAEIGRALKDVLIDKNFKREDLFITTKLWNSYHDRVQFGIEESLCKLQLDYIDLYLLHWPVTFEHHEDGKTLLDEKGTIILRIFDLKSVWQQLESLVDQKLVKSIGVCNFGIENLLLLLSFCRIKPAMNQIEYHPYLQQKELIELCKKNDIAITAYSSLGSQREQNQESMLENKDLIKIAEKHKTTVPVVILSWIRNKGIIIIPKSKSSARQEENMKTVELTRDEIETINSMDKHHRFVDPLSFGPDRFK